MAENEKAIEKAKKSPLAIGSRGIQLGTLDDAWRFAHIIIQAGMAPRGMETNEKLVLAIECGAEVGLPPMQAIQGIAIINNKPAIMGDLALALVLNSPQCQDVKEHIEGEGEDMVAICRALRTGQDEWKETRFDVEDAKIAKLWDKTGPWQNYPQRMLMYRARGFRLRDSFADVLRGMHLVEEFIGVPADPPPSSEVSADVGTREERAELPAPEPEPTLQQELAEAIEGALVGKRADLSVEERDALMASLARTTMDDKDIDWTKSENWTEEVCQKVMAAVQEFGIPDDLLPEPQETADG